jgi:hypothetical protein
LLLARRAGSIRRPESVAAWLHRTAIRVCARARRTEIRRRVREVPLIANAAREESRSVSRSASDVLLALEEEVERLPERYRTPLLLCYWRGMTQAEAARCLGCSEGSVKTSGTRSQTTRHASDPTRPGPASDSRRAFGRCDGAARTARSHGRIDAPGSSGSPGGGDVGPGNDNGPPKRVSLCRRSDTDSGSTDPRRERHARTSESRSAASTLGAESGAQVRGSTVAGGSDCPNWLTAIAACRGSRGGGLFSGWALARVRFSR